MNFPVTIIGCLCLTPALAAVAHPGPAQTGRVGVRQIVVATEAEADIARQMVASGVPFETLARERSLDAYTAAGGGFLGAVSISDLRREFADALAPISPGDMSAPVRIGTEYFLFKRLTEAETNWTVLEAAGLEAAGQGRTERAFSNFQEALALAERFGPSDHRFARSLADMGELHRILGNGAEAETFLRRAVPVYEDLAGQQDAFQPDLAQTLNSLGLALSGQSRYSEAEPFYRRALELREAVRGPEHPEVAIALNNLAEAYLADGRYDEAGPLYERALDILNDSLGPSHPATVSTQNNLIAFREALLPEVLERFAEIVFFATFKDEDFQTRTESFERMLALAPLAEDSFIEMKDAFFQADLFDLAEAVLRRGVERFPDTRTLPYHLGELLQTLGRTRDAMAVFEAATALSPEDLDPATDRGQLGLLYRRMGDMHTVLSEFEEAEADYMRALEVDPETRDGHVSFGQMYFLSDRLDEALEEYRRAEELEPDDFGLQLNMAETHSALTEWSEAAAAAARARELDPSNSRALYLQGTALVRLGNSEDGRNVLQEFTRLESEAQEQEHDLREAEAINSDAVAALVAGDGETAIELFRNGVDAYPDDRILHVNMALAAIRLERFQEAAALLEDVITREISGHYLVHKELAEVYDKLGDAAASERHHDAYIEKRDSELGAALVFGQ